MRVVLDPGDLYGLPLERFTAERNTLAKELRAKGRRDDAALVSAMRKPSLAAWAVNQLVRTQRRAVAALFDAGAALQSAQSDLLAGRGDARALREAGKRERTSVAKLVEAARGLLSSEGHELSPVVLERVSDTLHAAALDERARAEVEHGCLRKELRHVGLGVELAAVPSGASSRSAAGKPRPSRKAAASDADRRSAQAERERSERLRAARRTEAEASRAAERARQALKSAQQRRDGAVESLAQAEAALADARGRAEQAAVTHQQARDALETL